MHVMLTHPDHGVKFALSESEIEHDEKFGWTRYTDDTPAEESVEAAPKVKRSYTRRVIDKPIEQPNSNALASDESEGQ